MFFFLVWFLFGSWESVGKENDVWGTWNLKLYKFLFKKMKDHLEIVVGELNCEDSPQAKVFFFGFLCNQTEL